MADRIIFWDKTRSLFPADQLDPASAHSKNREQRSEQEIQKIRSDHMAHGGTDPQRRRGMLFWPYQPLKTPGQGTWQIMRFPTNMPIGPPSGDWSPFRSRGG